ncbi:MAG: 16S rRNA (uracil(1498)-N(3))-methyltransferase [Bacteroidota bacterium]
MQLFYTTQITDTTAELDAEETRHLQVLRKKVGDDIYLVNGKGDLITARIADLKKKATLLDIIDREHTPPPAQNIHIAIAPPKNMTRFEWFLEKATEIGIQQVTPLISERSERKKLRLDRAEKIVLSAMKQANRVYLPKVNEVSTFAQFMKQEEMKNDELIKYIGHCEAGDKVRIWNNYEAGKDVVVLIGPEGDFSPLEIEQAQAVGFQGVDLGQVRLRTETAGIVVCHTINLKNQI